MIQHCSISPSAIVLSLPDINLRFPFLSFPSQAAAVASRAKVNTVQPEKEGGGKKRATLFLGTHEKFLYTSSFTVGFQTGDARLADGEERISHHEWGKCMRAQPFSSSCSSSVVDDGQVLSLAPDVVLRRREPPGPVPEVVRPGGAVPVAVHRADQHHHVAVKVDQVLLKVFRAAR